MEGTANLAMELSLDLFDNDVTVTLCIDDLLSGLGIGLDEHLVVPG